MDRLLPKIISDDARLHYHLNNHTLDCSGSVHFKPNVKSDLSNVSSEFMVIH